jgi:CRISPR-associated protein Cmx8
MHLLKVGNNIKSVAAGRLAPQRHLLDRYLDVVGRPGEKPPFANPLFRRALMLGVLNDLRWFEPFGEMFAEWPHKFFVPSADVPKVSWFWADARKKYLEVMQNMADEPVESQDPSDRLAVLVYRLVRTYLAVKAQNKSGINPEQFKSGDKIDWDRVPQRYKDDRRQIAESLFLEYRSRHDRAFVDYFVARLGAVKQFINEDDYLAVTHALMNSSDDVKTLTLLALSANS